MIRVHLRNFIFMKICSFITIRFYFDFEKFFTVGRFAIKLFLNISADFIQNSIIFSNMSYKIIHPFTLTIITFYILAHLWKHYMQRPNFFIIIQVTNKVFIAFFTSRNLVTKSRL